MSELTYEPYNKKSLAVRGDKKLYQKVIKQLNGRWNARMKGGEGWLIPIEKEKEIIKLIKALSEDDKLEIIEKFSLSSLAILPIKKFNFHLHLHSNIIHFL